jgi:hypothetical protein
MVQPNELKIGNWVMAPMRLTTESYETKDFNTLIPYRIVFISENYGHAELFQPIPISPEILEKAGFNLRVIEESVFKEKYYANRAFWFDKEPFIEGYQFSIRGHSYFNCFIKYVHQIQDLYFALTGEELNITL